MINKFVVALGGFNDKAIEANPIYFCLVHPVSRAFGEEEDSEPVEEAVVKTCDTISAHYNLPNQDSTCVTVTVIWMSMTPEAMKIGMGECRGRTNCSK